MTGLPASLNRYPMLSTELIVAGLSDRRAQKCTNLLAAVARDRPCRSIYRFSRQRYSSATMVARRTAWASRRERSTDQVKEAD